MRRLPFFLSLIALSSFAGTSRYVDAPELQTKDRAAININFQALDIEMNDLKNRAIKRSRDIGIFNVKDYGAKGDGVHDDAPAINATIQAANGGVVQLGDGDFYITSPILVNKFGTTINGMARNTTTGSDGTRFINGSSSHCFVVGGGVNNSTIQNLTIIGNTGSVDGIYYEMSSIGHARVINVYMEVKNFGINVNPGDGVHLYLESVRIYGGDIPFRLVSSGIVINTITAYNCYAQNATGNAGWKISGVGNFVCVGCSSDNNFYGFELEDVSATFIGCSIENNTSKGIYGHGIGNYTFINPYAYAQLMPFEFNNSNMSVTFINPRTDATPSGSSLYIASSNGECAMVGRPLLDAGLQGNTLDHFMLYTNASGLQTNSLKLLGNLATSTTNKSATFTADNKIVYLCNAGSGSFTANLPAAATYGGRVYTFKKVDASANTITIDGNAAETIDGAATRVMNTYNEKLTIMSDGTNWVIIG